MGSPLPTLPIETVARLVNGWGSVPRATAGEADEPYPSASTVLGGAVPDRALAELTDEVLRATADLLFPVFHADEAAERTERLNQLLTLVDVRPAVQATGEQVEQVWLQPAESESWLLAAAVLSLLTQLVEHRPDRLGTCSGDRCADVYVDASPAGHRRFCSVTCQTRARVAAFRGRSVR